VSDLPSVTGLMAVFNGERFVAEALLSVMEQDYPADRLDVVVVDDGSTDATADIVSAIADAHPGRVHLIRQANAGNCAATNVAIEAAEGEILAVIDADDAWPPNKTRRQVALLTARPEVGLVYGDMTVIDEQGTVVQQSWLANDVTPQGLGAGGLLAGNNVTGSSIMLRADIARAICPMPVDLPYADWYFAVCVAERCPIAYLERPRTLYRLHDDNTCLGTQGPRRERELRKALRFQRWCLRRLLPGGATAQQLAEAWAAFERNTREVLELAGTPFAVVIEVSDAERVTARAGVELGERELRRGDPASALFHFVVAAATDPFAAAARTGLEVSLATVDPSVAMEGQDPLQATAPFVVTADAAELLQRPELLRAYVAALEGQSGVSLAIDASTLDPERAGADLSGLVDATPGADDLDLIAIIRPLDELGRARFAAGTHALLGEQALPGHAAPRFGTSGLASLSALAARAGAAAAAATN
jgi:glycosyltransferase involved in cell wall biosynthesis